MTSWLLYYAVLDGPLGDQSAWVSDIVLRPAVAGNEPHHGRQDFPLNLNSSSSPPASLLTPRRRPDDR
jgi:hypothetical protein